MGSITSGTYEPRYHRPALVMPGTLVRHHKGGLYLVLAQAEMDEEDPVIIVYLSIETGQVHYREISEFFSPVERPVAHHRETPTWRFNFVREAPDLLRGYR